MKDEVDLDVSTGYCEGGDDVLHNEAGEGEHQAVAVRGPGLNNNTNIEFGRDLEQNTSTKPTS